MYDRGIGATLAVFPDIAITVEQTVTKGDMVVVRWSGTGTHEGDYFGIAPTGKTVNFTGANLYLLSCGRIVQSWSFLDGLGLLQQLHEPTAEATPA
jgi:predicted ester cyclase